MSTTMHRAHATLEIKSADAARGIIRGIASAPSTDSVGDQMVPEGAVFELPMPFLHEHDRRSPLGRVVEAKVTSAGIEIVAQVARGVTDKIDEVFALLKAGLIAGLSIGFSGLEYEPLKGRGRRYTKWKWLETSAVVLPAQSAATILSVKKADHEVMQRLGMMPAHQSSSLALKMKQALLDATPERPAPMVTIGVRYRMTVRRDADGNIATCLLEPLSYVQLPKEPA